MMKEYIAPTIERSWICPLPEGYAPQIPPPLPPSSWMLARERLRQPMIDLPPEPEPLIREPTYFQPIEEPTYFQPIEEPTYFQPIIEPIYFPVTEYRETEDRSSGW